MRLIRTHEIRLMWDGNQVCALAGANLQEGVAGFDNDVPAALEDLARMIRTDPATTIWVPAWAKQYREGEGLKAACPECGHVTDMGSSTRCGRIPARLAAKSSK